MHVLQLNIEMGLQSKCEQALIFQPSNRLRIDVRVNQKV